MFFSFFLVFWLVLLGLILMFVGFGFYFLVFFGCFCGAFVGCFCVFVGFSQVHISPKVLEDEENKRRQVV